MAIPQGELSAAKASRHYGIDLFRLISMMMVVILHVLDAGGVLEGTIGKSGNYEVAWLIETACYGAVNCFALISGFVGVHAKHRYTNIVMLWLQVVCINMVLTLIQFAVDPSSFGWGVLGLSLFPVFTRDYWYFTDYTILFFFMPLLNAAVQSLKKEVLRPLLGIVTGMYCLSAVFPGPSFNSDPSFRADPFGLNDGYSVMWLMVLYLIGAYIAVHGIFPSFRRHTWLWIYIVATVAAVGSKFVLEYAPKTVLEFVPAMALINYHSPLIVIGSVALLQVFSACSVLPKPVCAGIKYLAPLSFGVYIIHLHPLIWNRLSGNLSDIGSMSLPRMLALVFGVSFVIYFGCMGIEAIRFYLFKCFKIKERVAVLEDRIAKNRT